VALLATLPWVKPPIKNFAPLGTVPGRWDPKI